MSISSLQPSSWPWIGSYFPRKQAAKQDVPDATQESHSEYVDELTELARLSCLSLQVARAGGVADPAPSPELVSYGIALDAAWSDFKAHLDELDAFDVKAEWVAA